MANSAVTRLYEKDLAFREPGSDAVTASGVIGALPLDKLDKVRPSDQRNKLGAQGYEIVIAVSALDLADADETYVFAAEVGAAGSAATKVGEVAVNGTGQFILALDAATIEALDADREEIELNLTVGGTTPSITFTAWLAPQTAH